MPPKQESGSNAQSNSNLSSDAPPPSIHSITKDGWGSRTEFQRSYGLGMTPEDFEEGNRILESFCKADMEEREKAQKSIHNGTRNLADTRAMRPASVGLVGLALTTLSAAQNATVTVFVPGTEDSPLVASIIGSDATATTYAIACNLGVDSNDCGIQGTITLTEGPATAKYTVAPVVDPNGETAFMGKYECSLAGTTSAVCIESHGGSQANFPGISTETYTGTDQPY
ncbi:hypothetical protein V491_07329, partial [Pseudogymnoascus sp. VKM F-3775]